MNENAIASESVDSRIATCILWPRKLTSSSVTADSCDLAALLNARLCADTLTTQCKQSAVIPCLATLPPSDTLWSTRPSGA
jgi:hypothetical protein